MEAKKDYAKPELKSQKIELGVFGCYEWEPPNQGELQPFLIACLADYRRDRFQTGKLRCSKAPLTGNQRVSARFRIARQDERLEDAVLAD